jgi:hypothetical protein
LGILKYYMSMKHSRAEEQLLFCFVQMHFHPDIRATNHIKTLLKKKISWDYFLIIVQHNRVNCLVLESLIPFSSQIPSSVIASLEAIRQKLAEEASIKITELNRVLSLLNANHIETILFKGIALAHLYDNIIFREWHDIDLIISKRDVYRVTNLLNRFGYSQVYPDDELNKVLEVEHGYPLRLEKDGIVIIIDLHWTIANPGENINFPMDHIWSQRSKTAVPNILADGLDEESLILILSYHHGSHFWYQFRYICDIAVFLNSNPGVNWNKITKHSAKLGIKRTLLVGISLANKLLKVPRPAQFDCAMKTEKSIRKLEYCIQRNFFKPTRTLSKVVYEHWISLNLRKSDMSTFISLVKFIVKPNILDKKLVALPRSLYFFYYLIRPFRIIWVHRKKVFSKS